MLKKKNVVVFVHSSGNVQCANQFHTTILPAYMAYSLLVDPVLA